MAREYWVETSPNGQPRFKRSHHGRHSDGYPSRRTRKVHFDVTQEEYNAVLEREQALKEANEALGRENRSLRSNCDAFERQYHQVQHLVPQLETQIRNLENDNRELRLVFDGHGSSRDREDSIRRLRHKNTKLQNDNDNLLQRIHILEQRVRDGLSNRAHRWMEEARAWKRRYEDLDDHVVRLQRKLDSTIQGYTKLDARAARLEQNNASYARSERQLRGIIDAYEAEMRRHGIRR